MKKEKVWENFVIPPMRRADALRTAWSLDAFVTGYLDVVCGAQMVIDWLGGA